MQEFFQSPPIFHEVHLSVVLQYFQFDPKFPIFRFCKILVLRMFPPFQKKRDPLGGIRSGLTYVPTGGYDPRLTPLVNREPKWKKRVKGAPIICELHGRHWTPAERTAKKNGRPLNLIMIMNIECPKEKHEKESGRLWTLMPSWKPAERTVEKKPRQTYLLHRLNWHQVENWKGLELWTMPLWTEEASGEPGWEDSRGTPPTAPPPHGLNFSQVENRKGLELPSVPLWTFKPQNRSIGGFSRLSSMPGVRNGQTSPVPSAVLLFTAYQNRHT